jgi:GrpB-like predicted nucleotidyltransferase (UPF0157 family)
VRPPRAPKSTRPADGILLVSWTPAWAERFRAARAELERAVGDRVLAVEHIGSTSIPGIRAKPVVDICVAVESFEAAHATVPPIEALDYVYRGEHGIPRRHFFQKGDPREVNLHMVEITSEEWQRHIAFRDYLRSHRDAALEYEALKQELAERHASDVEAYAAAKTPFVRKIIALTRA